MRPFWKWILVVLALLLAGGFAALSFIAGGPRDALYMARYALPNMHRGNLRVGDAAPDASLVALDGVNRFRIRDRLRARPLVLVFGSYT